MESHIEHRIPTTQYGYISVYLPLGVALEDEAIQSVVQDHARLTEAFNAKDGLESKDFQAFLINQLLENSTNHVETMEMMSEKQKWCVNEVKKSLATINRRNNKQ